MEIGPLQQQSAEWPSKILPGFTPEEWLPGTNDEDRSKLKSQTPETSLF